MSEQPTLSFSMSIEEGINDLSIATPPSTYSYFIIARNTRDEISVPFDVLLNLVVDQLRLKIVKNQPSEQPDDSKCILLDRVSTVQQGISYLKQLNSSSLEECKDYDVIYLTIESIFHAGYCTAMINRAQSMPDTNFHVRKIDRLFKLSNDNKTPAGRRVGYRWKPLANLTIGDSKLNMIDNLDAIKILSHEANTQAHIHAKKMKDACARRRRNPNAPPRRRQTVRAKRSVNFNRALKYLDMVKTAGIGLQDLKKFTEQITDVRQCDRLFPSMLEAVRSSINAMKRAELNIIPGVEKMEVTEV